MKRPELSIFAHDTGRGAGVAYFLGAVVPLVILGVVLERYVLNPIAAPGDQLADFGSPAIVPLFAAVGMLSLACFFMLRKLVRRSLDENRTLAYYDSLTGLPNRRLYRERLEYALEIAKRDGSIVATCFLDLDGFKRVNDTLGHGTGDRLLCAVSKRLQDSVRASDAVARMDDETAKAAVSRLGGDEFTFLLPGITDAQDARRAAHRVLDAFRQPFEIDGAEITATASIGIAVYPFDGADAVELLKNADVAMYSAKERGRDNYQFFSEAMNQAARRKLDLERRLRRAIDDDALTLYYQPVYSGASGEVTSAEALLRWTDPELGSVSPSEFIPIAEDTGLIFRLGEWVLRVACGQARMWVDAGFVALRIGVNVSAAQLRQPGFPGTVARALAESELPAENLEIEVSEKSIVDGDAATKNALEQLHAMGVNLAVDDFGTGRSSLAYLHRFPIRRLKIDRTFVAELSDDPKDARLAAAIVALAHSLRLKVIAEGVETTAQASHLRRLGCDDLQGYLFSQAVPAMQFSALLSRSKPECDESVRS